mgnify:CR=1 FL=1
MSKKIIALALVLVTIATVFTACQKKLDMYKINGVDIPVVTDEDGKAVIDEDNRICAIVTDSDGEVVEYAKNEPQTYWITVENSFVVDDTVYTPVFTMKGIDGWEFTPIGGLEKKKTNGKCKIECSAVIEKDYIDKTLDEYLEVRDERNIQAKEALEKEGYKVSVEKKVVEATVDRIQMIYYKEQIFNSDGSLANYSESLFFQQGENNKYTIKYVSSEGIGHDEKFNFLEFVNNNVTIKPEKEETTETK